MPTSSPNNLSFLANNKYEFVIERLPNFQFFVQGINMPTITLGDTVTASPWVDLHTPSNKLIFEQLTMTYAIDEDMQSWFDLYTWMVNLGNPESLDKTGVLTRDPGRPNSVMSDATLFIKTNSNNPNIKVTFVDIFPVDLTGFQLSSSEGQDFQTSTVTFSYSYFQIEKL